MPHPRDLPQLQTSNLHPLSDPEYDCTSPYPPSSPSTCPESDEPVSPDQINLRASISNLSDSKLRTILVRLAESDPRFYQAIAKEVLTVTDPLPENQPAKLTPKRQRSRARRNHKRLSLSSADALRCAHMQETQLVRGQMTDADEETAYHPGHLEEALYEFVSGGSPQVVRAITMWSCCDEDEWSPGCAIAPSSILAVPTRTRMYNSGTHLDVVYPDALPDSGLESGSHVRTDCQRDRDRPS